MTPLGRAVLAIEDMTGWGADGEPHIEIVRAVIQAIREPSEAMEQAGYGNSKGDPDNTGIVDNPRPDDAWRAMIDALLAEGE